MKTLDKNLIALAAVIAALASSTGAHAYWNLGSTPDASDKNSAGTILSDVKLDSISGVYAANGGTFNSSTSYSITGFGSGATWSAGTLVSYSGGYGMVSDGSVQPNHAIDNGPATSNYSTTPIGLGNTEAVLLDFSHSVALSGISIGYKSGDADISLFRFAGNTANPYASGPSLVGDGANLGAMLANGWELVGNYTDLTSDNSVPYTFNGVNGGTSATKGSSWWLISAYNTNYGGGYSQGNDYFKLLAVAGTKCTSTTPGVCGPGEIPPPPPAAPEPASLALVAVGLAGAYGARRRRPGAVATAD